MGEEARGPPRAALRARGLTVEYRRGLPPALQGFDLDVAQGECLAVVGPSGSGKSTLLKAAAGLLGPAAGSIEVLGHIAGAPAVRGMVGYIPQQLGLVRSRTALANALMGALSRTPLLASLRGRYLAPDEAAARAALEAVGLAHKAGERVAELSGGERQRVAIARTLVQRPDLLLADEFVANLDAATALDILALMAGLRARGLTIVMAMHDLELVRAYADRGIVLSRGENVQEFSASSMDIARIGEVLASGRST